MNYPKSTRELWINLVGTMGETNVGNVDLSSTAVTSAKVPGWGPSKAGFGFTILQFKKKKSLSVVYPLKTSGPPKIAGVKKNYLAHIDKSSHEVLVAQGVDSILCLFLRRVLHNPK